jgi:hypothetical protein
MARTHPKARLIFLNSIGWHQNCDAKDFRKPKLLRLTSTYRDRRPGQYCSDNFLPAFLRPSLEFCPSI